MSIKKSLSRGRAGGQIRTANKKKFNEWYNIIVKALLEFPKFV